MRSIKLNFFMTSISQRIFRRVVKLIRVRSVIGVNKVLVGLSFVMINLLKLNVFLFELLNLLTSFSRSLLKAYYFFLILETVASQPQAFSIQESDLLLQLRILLLQPFDLLLKTNKIFTQFQCAQFFILQDLLTKLILLSLQIAKRFV